MPQATVPTFYLHAKLHRPALPEDYISRPRLLAQLDKTLHYRLGTITAPAGYGKSTLASAWVEQVDYPVVWLSLDQADDDLVTFVNYFVFAVRSVVPEFGERVLTLAQASSRPPLVTIITYLLHALDQLEQDIVLVLDDFHLITSGEVHELLGKLLYYQMPHFHLLITSRHDLPRPLATLRAKGRLVELRAKDLAFSKTEVADFVQKALPAFFDTETIRNLTEKTEGWPVGLRLVTIAVRRWGVVDHKPTVLQVEDAYVFEYLVNEILSRQPTAVRDFLLKSAILNRFCVPLCAAILRPETAVQKIIDQLEREGLFIESLDKHKAWYRYHHLFREVLLHQLEEQLPPAEISAIRLQASNWLAENGFVEEAIEYALAGDDLKKAADILAEQGFTLINEERWLLLENLLNKFPPAAINENPDLLLLVGWLSLTRMQLPRMENIRSYLAKHPEAASLTLAKGRFMHCSIHMFAAIKYDWASDYEKAIFHARQALTDARPEWGVLLSYSWVHLGIASHHLVGEQAALVALANDSLQAESIPSRLRRQIAIGCVDWLSGDLDKLLQTARQALALMQGLRLPKSSTMFHYLAGSAYYQQNDLNRAAQHFSVVVDLGYGALPLAYVQSLIGQALIYQAQGMSDEAWRMAETAVNFGLATESPKNLLLARAFQAELALRQNKKERAILWATQQEGMPPLGYTMPFMYQERLALPQIWLAEESPESLHKAEVELTCVYDFVSQHHNLPVQIKVLTLQSLLYQAQKKPRAAEEVLVQAVRLAQFGGFIRPFVDLGPKMAASLKHLYLQGHSSAFFQQILDAFPASKPAPNVALPLALIESLTERETEVLSLLAQRLSNKEIAQIMVISPETVKRHTVNIYQKLQVKGRRQAVAKAYSLGLLVDITSSN